MSAILASPVRARGGFTVDLLNRLSPRRGITIRQGVAYGPGPRHRLDVYSPARAAAAAPVPAVVFFYGGGWEEGDRGIYRFVGAALAARGIVTLVPDYRLYPEVRFPAFMEDAAAAVAWARSFLTTLGGDPGRLFLMGHSAGAQIATLLALDPRYLRAAGAGGLRIAGVIGLAGPYDFLPLRSPTLKAIFGPEAAWPASQPITYASAAAPPMLLAAGTADRVVDPGNTERLAARLRAVGAAVEMRLFRGLGHRVLIGGFASALAPLLPVRRETLRFIAQGGGAA
ncbi:MAG: alpha/beta hydrolase [Acidibrevibacterium sp.]|uniref:alpha/beta hydrolase n=1 Tax=Acidibrevibacterium sp. TaxID=2606776 RepID=UPI003CFBCA36